MTWLDLESEIAEEFAEAANEAEGEIIVGGNLSLRCGTMGLRAWPTGVPRQGADARRESNRRWFAAWYARQKADRSAATYRKILERNARASAAYRARKLAEAARLAALQPSLALRALAPAGMGRCAADDCGAGFVLVRRTQTYCSRACRERMKCRRRRGRSAARHRSNSLPRLDSAAAHMFGREGMGSEP